MSARNTTNNIHDKAARELIPRIEAVAVRIEADRLLPAELLSALHDARLFHMLSPRAIGGEEIDLITFFHAIEALASADASTAWCVGQACGVSMAAAYLELDVAREVFGGRTSVVASGPNTRNAHAVKTKGGYRVTGKWMYASGNRHAQWLGAHCTVIEADGSPARGADGRAVERTMLFPRSQAMITDTWHVMGLRGTGSDNYEVADLFVADDYTFTRDAAADRRVHAPLYTHFTGFNIFGLSFSAVALGIARATLQDFVALATKKLPQAGNAVPLRENAVIQSKVAQAEAQLLASRALVLDIYGQLWEQALENREFSLMDRARMRIASTYAMNEASKVVDVAYHAAGGTAIFQFNPFERRFRDINCATQQGQASQANFETIGQVLLGLPPKARV